jgi:WD40 repeat protein
MMKDISLVLNRSWKRCSQITAAILLLVSARPILAQGSPDIVWQGQHAGYVRYTTFSPDGQQLASGADDKKNILWQASDGTLMRSITQCSGVGCRGSGFGFYSPDGQQLATAGIRFWRTSDGTLIRSLGIGGTIALSPDWQYIASSITVSTYPSQSRSITLFRSDGSQVWQNPSAGGGATVFSPDGQLIATIGFAGIDLIRPSDGTVVRTIIGPRGGVLVFSPDGQFLATNGGGGGSFQWDDTIKIFRVADGALIRTLTATGVVTSIAFTPDNQTLLSSSWDSNYDPVNGYIPATGSIRFWRMSDGALLKTYDQNTGTSANALSVSPDGKLFSYSHDSTVFVARVPSLSCAFSISPAGANLPTEGGSGSIDVSAPAGCSWRAVSRVSWIRLTGQTSGTGNGTVPFTATNSSSSGMTGLIIVAEQTFPVHLGQEPCSYTLSANDSTWSADGGTAAVGVQTPGGCGWTARSNDDWITITKISRDNGGGSVTYSVAPSNVNRTGTLTVAEQTVTVRQDINACRYTLSPTSQTISSAGGPGEFSVTTTSDCSWNATSNAIWVRIDSGGSGSGNGTVNYSLVQNQSGFSRTATISVADKTFTIFQPSEAAEGSSPTPTISPTPTPTSTPMSSPTSTPPPPSTPTPTSALTPTPTPTPSPSPDTTPIPTPTPTATFPSSPTPSATSTATAIPTATPSATPESKPPSQPLNISTRGRVESGDNAMIGGFIVTGTAPKKVVVRAIGPSLKSSLPGALSDPALELRGSDGSLIRQNDNWKDDAAQALEIQGSGVAPSHDLESALVATLAPGNYTATVTGKNSSTGIGLVEIYDLNRWGDCQLANISTRGVVQNADNVLIGGFILGGANGPARILVRAIGPSLGKMGVANAVSDPTLELRDSNGALLFANDNWKDQQQAAIEQTGIPPNESSESAIVADLTPGAYTAVVAAKGLSGISVIEVYHLR